MFATDYLSGQLIDAEGAWYVWTVVDDNTLDWDLTEWADPYMLGVTGKEVTIGGYGRGRGAELQA